MIVLGIVEGHFNHRELYVANPGIGAVLQLQVPVSEGFACRASHGNLRVNGQLPDSRQTRS